MFDPSAYKLNFPVLTITTNLESRMICIGTYVHSDGVSHFSGLQRLTLCPAEE